MRAAAGACERGLARLQRANAGPPPLHTHQAPGWGLRRRNQINSDQRNQREPRKASAWPRPSLSKTNQSKPPTTPAGAGAPREPQASGGLRVTAARGWPLGWAQQGLTHNCSRPAAGFQGLLSSAPGSLHLLRPAAPPRGARADFSVN